MCVGKHTASQHSFMPKSGAFVLAKHDFDVYSLISSAATDSDESAPVLREMNLFVLPMRSYRVLIGRGKQQPVVITTSSPLFVCRTQPMPIGMQQKIHQPLSSSADHRGDLPLAGIVPMGTVRRMLWTPKGVSVRWMPSLEGTVAAGVCGASGAVPLFEAAELEEDLSEFAADPLAMVYRGARRSRARWRARSGASASLRYLALPSTLQGEELYAGIPAAVVACADIL